MNDNIQRLIQAAADPGSISDKELHELLADPTAREFYDMMRRTADVLYPTPEHDVDAEWRAFSQAHGLAPERTARRRFPQILRRPAVAAAVAAVAILAVSAATIGIVRTASRPAQTQHQEVAAPASAWPAAEVAPADTILTAISSTPTTITFKDETLERVLTDVAEYYGAKLSFSRDSSRSLRLYFQWDQEQTLAEVVGQLNNFEQISISLKGDTITVD